MKKLNCIIVDDEELARKLLENYVSKTDFIEHLASFESPLQAIPYLDEHTVDLIFLDIQMPDLSGTDFAELLKKYNIKVIFTTAYSEYALQGFELNALDYLLKPITFQRFLDAVQKYPKQEQNASNQQTITIKSGYDLHKVNLKDILYIESSGEYVNYYLTQGNKIMANQSLTKLSNQLPNYFLRVHRSYIVNKNKVTSLKGRDLLLDEIIIPISDSYYSKAKKDIF